MAEKTKGELLQEELYYKRENCYDKMDEAQAQTAYDFCEGYKTFLDRGKTERECATYTSKLLSEAGYKPYERGAKYKPGDRFYLNHRGKSVFAVTMGSAPLENGLSIVASHIDSPRLDLKPAPLIEDGGLAYFKTHYYGGIKKYQWLALPLSLHGVVFLRGGGDVTVSVGDEPGDPVFCITDLLPHLGRDIYEKKVKDIIKGEKLHVLIGSRPFLDDKVSEKVKLNIMRILNEKYGFKEGDFISAELELVPAGTARDVGFDRSLIGAYGHDDRSSAYPSLIAHMEAKTPARTTICSMLDKEEIGSEGNTGMQSEIFRYLVQHLADDAGANLGTVLSNSRCLSADVSAAFDPGWAEQYDQRNAAWINRGLTIIKYVGSGGKSGSSDANAEFMSLVTRIFDEAGVLWHAAELGAVDAGGGGTVAKFLAKLDIDVIDVGSPTLSMHSPFELVSKADVYMAYKGYKAFYEYK